MKNLPQTNNKRAKALAERIEEGATALLDFAQGLSDAEWQIPVTGDGRTIGVVIHHVASMYPLEVELAGKLAAGQPITGATKEVVDEINAQHARDYATVKKAKTLDFLQKTSMEAAAAVARFTDTELDNSATVSLNADAPLTAQFFIEDHALRHSYHHLARIQMTLAGA